MSLRRPDRQAEADRKSIPVRPLVTISWRLVVQGLGVALVIAAFIWTLLDSELPTGESLGRASAPAMMGLVVAVVLALVARQRGASLFAIWLMVATAASLFGVVSDMTKPKGNPPALQAEIDAKMRQVFRNARPGEDGLVLERQKRDALRWAQRKSLGNAVAFYQVLADLQEENLTTATLLRGHISKLDLQQVPANADKLGVRSELDATAANLLAVRDLLDATSARARSSVETARQKLTARRADPVLSRGYLTGLSESLSDGDQQLQPLRALLEPHIQMVTYLQRTWGSWKYDTNTDEFVFDNPNDQHSFGSAREILLRRLNPTP
jgi:hypothetical protein